jgi:hypothetical protein
LIQKNLLPRAQALRFNRQTCLRESGDHSSACAILIKKQGNKD